VKLQFKKRRLIPVAFAVMAVVALSGVAYAFWTAGGSGTGGGTTAAGASDLTVSGAALTPMYPGAAAQTTSVTITNNSTASAHVTTVSISALSTNAGTSCTIADFTVGSAVTVPALSRDIASGNSVTVTGPTIQFFNDLTRNQDLCKGAIVTLTYSVS
jgi:hypothetical protein